MTTERQKRLARALTGLVPRIPYLDAEAVRDMVAKRHMRQLSPESAVWLATVAHIRHQHTDYDALMDEGYDKDAARFFVVEETNAVLDSWGATRRLDPDAETDEGMPAPGGSNRPDGGVIDD